jgi:hypothetical protein
MTETELKLIAPAAMTGLSSSPNAGYSTPAAIGTPSELVIALAIVFVLLIIGGVLADVGTRWVASAYVDARGAALEP